jgi:ABC-type thiamine transport system ATPase subunit
VTQAGLSAIPNSANFATYTNALQSLSQDTQKAEDAAILRNSGAGKNISDLFAGFNTKSGMDFGKNYWNSNTAKKKKKAGVNTNTFQGINGPVELKAENFS